MNQFLFTYVNLIAKEKLPTMKNLHSVLIMLFMLATHVTSAQKTSAAIQFKEPKMNSVWTDYSKLKDALVASKPEDAKVFADDLKKSAKAASIHDVETAATSLASASSLEEQRKLFTGLTAAIAKSIANNSLSSGIIYKDYCPMANDNAGGYWFSSEKSITNPYFGDSMLHCGAVQETIH